MHSLVKRALIGLSVAALGAGFLGAAAPAYADEPASIIEPQSGEADATAEFRTISHDVGLVETPRRGAPVVAQLNAGTPVTAYCAFFLDGIDWVKIQHNARFGFVPNSAVGGAGQLPYTCPSEVDTIEYRAFAKDFKIGDLSAKLEPWNCPAERPLLANIPFHRDDILIGAPNGVRVADVKKGIHAVVDTTPTETTYGGKRYAHGHRGGSMTSWGGELRGELYVTCTNDVNKAYSPR